MIVRCQLYTMHANALGADDVFFHVIYEEAFLRRFVEAFACGVIDVGIGFVKAEFVGEEVGRVGVKETWEALFNTLGMMRAEVA